MGKFRIKKKKETNLIWNKLRHYIDLIIVVCCLVITFNIHPNNSTDQVAEKSKMLYIFHDYEWNEYILNDTIHWAADSWAYLFDDEVPSDIKWDESTENSASLAELTNAQDQSEKQDTETKTNENINTNNDVKNNQVSLDDIMTDLWIEDIDISNEHNNAQSSNTTTTGDSSLIINVSDFPDNTDPNGTRYTIKEENDEDSSILIIEKQDGNTSKSDPSNNENLLSARTFTYRYEWWVQPTLIPRDQLSLYNSSISSSSYNNSDWSISKTDNWTSNNSTNIIDEYADCMTPWWYKIMHWDSVLAYQQMSNAPDICNIERRFCWKWKLSWTYTQQWCSINENYTYEQWWEAEVTKKEKESRYKTSQNPDGTVSVVEDVTTWSFVFDRPRPDDSINYETKYNLRTEEPEVDQTKQAHRDCTAPWWEKVWHWMFVQAFKHSNWFSDSPCEAQLRLCTNWDLIWTYTEPTCKTRDTSFIDWINGSPTRETYSKEKLERVKDQINEERNYDKSFKRYSTSDELDRILYILDS